MQQQVRRVSARWPACHTHNCFPSGVWSTQSLAVCQRRTTHKLAYFWWHRPSRHRWSARFRMAEENVAFICKLPAADLSGYSGRHSAQLTRFPVAAWHSPSPGAGASPPWHHVATSARVPAWEVGKQGRHSASRWAHQANSSLQLHANTYPTALIYKGDCFSKLCLFI